jgi:hypothetical protein
VAPAFLYPFSLLSTLNDIISKLYHPIAPSAAEPTLPHDIHGHAAIRRGIKPHGIGV